MDPEKKLDRLVTLRSAVMGAVLAAVGAIIASGMGAVATLWGVYITTDSAAEQSRVQFLRPHQQALYAEFLDAVDAAALANRQRGDGGAIAPEQVAAASDALDAVEDLAKELELLANDETIIAAESVVEDLRNDYEAMWNTYCEQTDDPECSPILFRVPIGAAPPPEPRETFVDKARDDLGADAD